MSPRTRFWLLIAAGLILVGFAVSARGRLGVALIVASIAVSVCAMRVVVKSWGQR